MSSMMKNTDIEDYLAQIPAYLLRPYTRESIRKDADAFTRLKETYRKMLKRHIAGSWAFAEAVQRIYGISLHDYMQGSFL